MAGLKTKFSVGLFLIIGVALSIIGIIWLGMSNVFEKGNYFVAYFDESVQGLEKDSPVKYRGVSIGRVHSILVAPDKNLIQVTMKIESGIQPEKEEGNIVAQLKTVGITGLMFVELDRKTRDDPDLSPAIDFPTTYPVIATQPSDRSKFFKGIDDVLNLLKQLDLKEISDNLVRVLERAERTMDEAQIKEISQKLKSVLEAVDTLMHSEQLQRFPQSASETATAYKKLAENADDTVTQIRRVVKRTDMAMAETLPRIRQSVENVKAATESLNDVLANGNHLVQESDAALTDLHRRLGYTLNRLDMVTMQLSGLLEQITDHPSQLIFGDPPARKSFGRKEVDNP